MTKPILFLALLLPLLLAAPADDLMASVPGFPKDYKTAVYTGYLDVKNGNRSLHYVFVESANGSGNKDPVTLWLNGGPGCSSLLGFIQEIGPYYLEDGIDYKLGDNLTENKYSWHKLSNLLFLESPAGVGYSYNLDTKYEYNDYNTADDALKAVVNFFEKFPEYKGRRLFIAGESYAGKYIPDLAVQIDLWNQRGEGTAINLVSIIIGNGVMAFDTLQRSTYEFMIDRKFIDPEIVPIYQSSCQTDPSSAGCRFFEIEYNKGTEEINPYNVYGYCYYNDSFDATQGRTEVRREYTSQEAIIERLKKQFSPGPSIPKSKYNGAPCAFFDGIHDYFNLNEIEFKAKFPGQRWNGPCAENITYIIDPAGSMGSYRYLLSLIPTSRKISIILYNGNWDAVVPYVDTLKNIRRLNLVESYTFNPWFTDKQHSGFEQLFSGVIFVTFKGASHQVPQTRRAEAYNLFDSIIAGHNAGTIFEKGVFGGQMETEQGQ